MIDNSPVSLWLPAVKLLSQCVVPTSRLDIFHSEFRPNPVSQTQQQETGVSQKAAVLFTNAKRDFASHDGAKTKLTEEKQLTTLIV